MKTVLIVDDSMFVRMMLKGILSQNGYEIIGEAESAEEAIEKYKQLKPDIVTMDIIMPGKNGLSATKDILEIDPRANIVMLSALTQQRYVMECLKAGAKDYVFKPINNKMILSTLNSIG